MILPESVDRVTLQAKLKEAGIPTMVYYAKPMHLQGAFAGTGSAIAVRNGRVSLSFGTYQAAGNAATASNSDISIYKNATVISTGAAAVYSDNSVNNRIFLAGGKLQGVSAAVEAKNGIVSFTNAVNTLSASAGPMILMDPDTRMGISTKMNADSAYTVKLNSETGTGILGYASPYHYVVGCIVPYDAGLYVENLENYNYLCALAAPNAAIDYAKECLTGLTPGSVYKIDGTSCIADENGTVPISESWMGKEITIVKAATASSTASPAQTLAVPARPEAPTGITAVDESVDGKHDGSISGFTGGLQLRYPGAETWTDVNSSTVTGLAPGDYAVRQQATGSAFAGQSITVTVGKGKQVITAGDITVVVTDGFVYDGTEKVPTFHLPQGLEESCVTVHYFDSNGALSGKPVNAGDYRFTIDISGSDAYADVNGLTNENWRYSIAKAAVAIIAEPLEDRLFTGKAITPSVCLIGQSAGLKENTDYTLSYSNNVSAGTATVTVVPVESSNYTFSEAAYTFRINPCPVTVAIDPIGKQLYTGSEIRPVTELTFEGVPEGMAPVLGEDYTVSYSNNVAVGEATFTVSPVKGSNLSVAENSASFRIAYGVAMNESGTVYVDGLPGTVEQGILWLEDENAKLITTYEHANAGASDPHTVYPTAMYVWELTFRTQGGYSVSRITELDNVLQYSGTSIRITGNQGIRFITSVPTAKKSALTGGGLAGYKLVEYGTLMGWYEPGKELLYGVNAKSVAYDRGSGTDQVFNRTGDLVQFTGMLTDLELEQSTRDLMTRPYMVLERTDGAGQTEQVVLYGGSITRSIGYVAYQNKDVFKVGSSSYEFIWNILAYAYPDLYEAEYQG